MYNSDLFRLEKYALTLWEVKTLENTENVAGLHFTVVIKHCLKNVTLPLKAKLSVLLFIVFNNKTNKLYVYPNISAN